MSDEIEDKDPLTETETENTVESAPADSEVAETGTGDSGMKAPAEDTAVPIPADTESSGQSSRPDSVGVPNRRYNSFRPSGEGAAPMPRMDRRDSYPRRNEGGPPGRSSRYRTYFRKKVCKFCTQKKAGIDYLDAGALRRFTTNRGKILPRRITGNCAKHQRKLALAIKRARVLALLPYTAK